MKIKVIGQLTIKRTMVALLSEESIIRPKESFIIEKGQLLKTVSRKTYDKMIMPLTVDVNLDECGRFVVECIMK
jgi:hypothetical protein